MADWTRSERTITWVEYRLELPSNWGEVGKVYGALKSELGDRARWDDVVTVTSDGGELIFRYEKESGRG